MVPLQPRQPRVRPSGGRFAENAHAEPSASLTDPEEPQPSGLVEPGLVLAQLLEAAAKLQELVPDAVMVGGSAAAFYAGHRDSYDHDHTLSDLSDRYDMVLEAIESQDGWVTNRVVPNKLILGEIGGIETGVRQLIRRVPLEVAHYPLPSGRLLTVPTAEEILRIKGYLVVARNQTRDYLDVAALSEWSGIDNAAKTLGDIDHYYADQHQGGLGISSQVVRQLADPRPKDSKTTRHLDQYKRLDRRWRDWGEVRAVCAELSRRILTTEAH